MRPGLRRPGDCWNLQTTDLPPGKVLTGVPEFEDIENNAIFRWLKWAQRSRGMSRNPLFH
jgi:hypothetical protein